MSWNNIPDDERLHLWKNLRKDISGLTLNEQMDAVSKFFSTIPYGSRSIDYYTPSEWPTPWEIIFHGKLCKSSISLLIFHTFSLLHTENIIELQLIDDGEDEYLLPIIDNQFVLNYELGKVNKCQDIATEIQILNTYTQQDIKIIK
jgi:hypothetical protein